MPQPTLLLIGKPGCHLCDEMKAVVLQVLHGSNLALEERDVRERPDWEARYLWDIPVLLSGDDEVVRHRVTERDLRQRLAKMGLSP